jgi:hypothetical protein
VLVLVLGVAAAIFVWHSARANTPHSDCSVVEQVAHQYIESKRSVTARENGSGDTKDLIAIADTESAVGDRIRAAEAAVSAPAIKDELEQWAQGAALSARLQRDAADQLPEPGDGADTVRAGSMTYNATAALHKVCPNMAGSSRPQ